MKNLTRKVYRGNDCSPMRQVPDSDRIRRFCSLEPSKPPFSVQSGGTSSDTHGTRTGIPLLGNLDAYGIDARHRKELWNLEITRLRKLNVSAEEGLKPNIEPKDALLQAKVESKVFGYIQSLAREIRYSLFVCVVDDAVEAWHNHHATSPGSSFALTCFHGLDRLQRKSTGPDVPGVDPGSEEHSESVSRYQAMYPKTNRRSEASETAKVPESNSRYPYSQQEFSDAFHYLVDQITATVAHVAIRVSESDYWLLVVLGCLAKLATKMKVIHGNFLGSINISVEKASVWFKEHRHSLSEAADHTALSDDSPIIDRHIQEHTAVSQWLTECITGVLLNLGDQKPWWEGDRFIDSCALVFDAGLKPTKTLLCQNNHGLISGSSDKIALSFASVALETVWKLSKMIIDEAEKSHPGNKTGNRPESYIELHLDLKDNRTGECLHKTKPPAKICNIIDYIILMIPISLANPLYGEGYRETLKALSTLSAFGISTARQIQIDGFVALKLDKSAVSAFTPKRKEITSPTEIIESEIGSRPDASARLQFGGSSSLLSSFLLSKRRSLLDQDRVEEGQTSSHFNILACMKFKFRKRNKSREEISSISKNWAIQEKAIVVPCPKYVTYVAFLTILLVAGGMACAFVVGERIPGVDPFNLTNFSWLIGGLSILVAKSMRVSDWTWRDFLSGRVSCRTVQELSDVSGLEPQDILFFLLSSQMYGILHFSGPFRSVFHTSSESDGFSIDVKPRLQTLLASGIVVVDVLTLEGSALLWLYLVPGNRGLHVVDPSGKGDDPRLFQVCRDPPRALEDGDAIITREASFKWMKVVGLYNLRNVEFR